MNAAAQNSPRHVRRFFAPMMVGLFPDLLSTGGVQLAGRQTAAALAGIAEARARPYRFLSLNDLLGEQEASVGKLPFRFRGFARNKMQFVSTAIGLARAHPRIVFTAHPNLAPVAELMRFFSTRTQIISGTHGIEVWQPLSALRRTALRRANLVLAPSSDTARKLAKVQGVDPCKIRELPWPLDPDFLRLAQSPETLALPPAFPCGKIILTVGRWAAHERYKGADWLIEAFADLSRERADLHLVLVGSGDDLPRLRGVARDSGISQRVHFLTGLSRSELIACYAAADVFALPSSGEGFGFVFLEAMALAKPVIGAPRGGIPDVVACGETGLLVKPENPRSLVNSLRMLLNDSEMCRRMGRRAAEVVHSRFSFELFQQGLTDVLEAMNFD